MVLCVVILLCVGCDQATKRVAESALMNQAPISLVGDTVRFQLITNTGGFLSLGASLPKWVRTAVFTIGAPLLLCAVLLWQIGLRESSWAQLVGFALVMGGGLGNVIDRVANDGRVTDFVSLGVGPLRTGIFNVADVAIMAGVALVLLQLGGRSEPQSEGEASS